MCLKFYNTRLSARLSARVSFLGTEIKIQIHTPNELTYRVYTVRMKLALRLRMKLAEMHVIFRRGKKLKPPPLTL